MFRRSHRKSRQGCKQCKRRHKKCDESKPICINCNIAGDVVCSYASKDSGATNSEAPRSISSSRASSAIPVDSSQSQSMACGSLLAKPTDCHGAGYINITHMELFRHFSTNPGKLFLGVEIPDAELLLIVDRALASPFLLSQLLSLSALHLSFQRPDKAQFYQAESLTLRENALKLYNETGQDINECNFVSVFFFAGMLGLHYFCSVFLVPQSTTEAFLDQFVQSIRLMRGVQAILGERWDEIVHSDIKSFLPDASGDRNYTDEVVVRLEELIITLNQSSGLDPINAKVIEEAIKSLCWVYKGEVRLDKSDGDQNCRMVTSWPTMLSEEFTVLIAERKPEALIVVACFSVLLHQCRNWWAVGASGQFLFDKLYNYLGAEWHSWLVWPKSILYDTGHILYGSADNFGP